MYRANALRKRGGRLAAVGGLLVTSVGVVAAAGPAGAQPGSQNFSGSAVGNLLSVDALNVPGELDLLNAQVAPALAEVDSAGGLMGGTGTPSNGNSTNGGANASTITSHGHATNLNADIGGTPNGGTGLGGITGGFLGGGTGLGGESGLGNLSNILDLGGTSGGGSNLLGGILDGGILGGGIGGTGSGGGIGNGNACVSDQHSGISLDNLIVCADQTAPPDHLNPVINTLLPLGGGGDTATNGGVGGVGSILSGNGGILGGIFGGNGLTGGQDISGSAILGGNVITACALAHDTSANSTGGTGSGAIGGNCLNAPGLGNHHGTSGVTSSSGTRVTNGTRVTSGTDSSAAASSSASSTSSSGSSATTCPGTNAEGGGNVTLPPSSNAGIQARSTTSLADIVLGSGTSLGGLLRNLESLNAAGTAGSAASGLVGLAGLSIRIVSPNTLCATALGVPGGASVTYSPSVVELVEGASANGTGGNVITTLGGAGNPTSTAGLGNLGSLTGILGTGGLFNMSLGRPANVHVNPDGTSASAQSSLLTLSIGLGGLTNSTGGASGITGGTGTELPILNNLIPGLLSSSSTSGSGSVLDGQLLNLQLAPLAVSAHAPVGGIDCATANCAPGGSPTNPLAQGRNSLADVELLSGLVSLPATVSTDSIVQLVNVPTAVTPPTPTPAPGPVTSVPGAPAAPAAGPSGTLPFTGEHPWIPFAGGGLLGAALLGLGIRRRMAHRSASSS